MELFKYFYKIYAVWLLPLSRDESINAIKRAYSIAQEYAKKLGGRIETIQPKHIYRDDKFGYYLQLGRITVNLPPASVFIIWGFYNSDEYFDFVRFIHDGRVYEWFVEPISYYPERVGVWVDEPLIFRETLYIDVHITTSEERDRAYGWPLGYYVAPLQPPQEMKQTKKPRRGVEKKR